MQNPELSPLVPGDRKATMTSISAALRASCLLLPLLAFAPAVAQAETLPPAKPAASYTMEFNWEKQEGGAVQKGRSRISVDGEKVREEAIPVRKSDTVDPRVRVYDRKAGTMIEFDPADPAKRYKSGPLADAAMPMAEGYAAIEKQAGKPIPVGGGQVGGNKCTGLAWGAENIGRPTGDRQILCVTDDGIVVSLERRTGSGSAKFNAMKVGREKPGADLFAPPAGFTQGQ